MGTESGFATLPVTTSVHISADEFEARLRRVAPAAPAAWGRILHRYAEDAGLAPDVIAVLAMKETARFRFTGKDPVFSPDASYHNYGGIKTNDSKATHRFPTVAAGIRGLVAHVAWYAYTEHIDAVCGRYQVFTAGMPTSYNGWPWSYTEFDPRHWTWGHGGNLRVVSDFGNGIWNFNPGYGASLVPLLEEFWS